MDSYPGEFTGHVLPLLFVAGLGTAATPAVPAPASASTEPSTTTPAGSPPIDPQTPQPPPDQFGPLLTALKKTLSAKRGFNIWDSSRGVNHDFHVVLVEKNVRFPPLKARPPSTPQQPLPVLHSPISPLTPSSPLYPDGIMAPIWIRKHREMIPSVFVLVLRLGEYSSPGGPLDLSKKEDEERVRDAELVQEITERKRTTVERAIKLAVILVCSRQLLDDPSLDSRLSLIRRQSGLDSRASLFVISPVPQSEVVNFVASFKGELYPAALDYYREHGRRVRRKRARQAPKGRLSDKGWNVRYDYKMGVFSEMRGEMEVSLKHYEDSYDTLVEMFSTPNLLVVRTKRWAEAKVLADCLTVKIAKIYLYLNEPSRACAQFNRHLARFRELSNIWGIGEQTFEFWSWLSKQYRLFAELVAIALRAGFRLPSLRPPPPPRPVPAGMPQPPSPGLVPPTILQHPGYYFYMAGLCAVQRRECFKTFLASTEPPIDGTPVSPAVSHESKVDHAEIIIDLYTKSYEYFKAHKTSRLSLFIASQIALTHFQAGNHEMALKFNERISRTYRRERWRDIVDSLAEISRVSALAVGDYPTAIRSLLGLLAPDSRISLDARAECAIELWHILETKEPSSEDAAVVDVDMSEVAPLFTCQAVFWRQTASVGEAVPFQVTIEAPPESKADALRFSSLALQFNDGRAPVVIGADGGESPEELANPTVTHLGSLGEPSQSQQERQATLYWLNGQKSIFTGTIARATEGELTLSMITLTLAVGKWTVNLAIIPDAAATRASWYLPQNGTDIPLLQPDPFSCSVYHRNLQVTAIIDHKAPAYLDEEFDIDIDVQNDDAVEIEVFLDILLQPGEDDSQNQIKVDERSSFSYIKEVPLGVLAPSSKLSKTIRLLSIGSPGERQLDVSIRAQPTLLGETSLPSTSSANSIPTSTEILQTLTIPAVPPIFASFDTHFHHRRRPGKHLLDFSQPDGWDGATEVTLIAKLCSAGPWDLDVVQMSLSTENAPQVRVLSSSLDGESSVILGWRPHEFFNAIFRLEVMPAISEDETSHPSLEVLWRRSGNETRPIRTSIPLVVRPKPLYPTITVRLPPIMRLHAPTSLTYRFSNPTERLLTLSLQVDSSEGFVFAGPRKIPQMTVAPTEERNITLTVIPLLVGPCAVPRVRVFEVDRLSPVEETPAGPTEDGVVQRKQKELPVVEEADVGQVVDQSQAHLETDLRIARGSERDDASEVSAGEVLARPFTVLVLPS
ncbi:hypothetical protein T439DRAFT_323501 [Meredithblackwellia eburnea MCA 4105]